jgi:hypothetical protein
MTKYQLYLLFLELKNMYQLTTDIIKKKNIHNLLINIEIDIYMNYSNDFFNKIFLEHFDNYILIFD